MVISTELPFVMKMFKRTTMRNPAAICPRISRASKKVTKIGHSELYHFTRARFKYYSGAFFARRISAERACRLIRPENCAQNAEKEQV
jgi:hypothetical protein